MKAYELKDYLLSLNGGWVDLETTVDTFKAGNPETEIHGIAVGWMSYTWAIEQAIKLNCNVFITHEPTLYTHLENTDDIFQFEGARKKRAFIEQCGIVILRCHDIWDGIEEIGIPDSWAGLLGLSDPVVKDRFLRIFEVENKTALDIAHQVLESTRPFGQEIVQLTGPANKPVTRIGIGTGAITPFMKLVDEYQVDLAICVDDGMRYCFEGAYAIDLNIPLIVINHAVSEEIGIMSLAKHLQSQFLQIPVYHIPQKCMYQIVS
jgi:putative NIF3 family GTP cyclohydrolase 1 type 2